MAVDPELLQRMNEGGQQDEAESLRMSLFKAVNREPQREAEVYQLAESRGLPPDTVDRNLDTVKRQEKLRGINIDDLMAKHPKTAKYMADEANASISIDDLTVFKQIEENAAKGGIGGTITDILGAYGQGILQVPGMAMSGVGELIEAGGRTLQRGAEKVLPEGVVEDIAAVDVPVPLPGESLKYAGRNIQRTGEMIAPDDPTLATEIAGGLGQVTAQIMATIAAPMTAGGMLFGMGVEQQAAAQRETGTLGSTLEADQALLMGGAWTTITEKTGIDFLMRRLPEPVQNAIKNKLVDVMLSGGGEAVQEVAEGIGQGLIEMASTNPDAEIFEGLEREALVAGSTGAIVRSIIHMATPGRARGDGAVDAVNNTISSAQEADIIDEAVALSQTAQTKTMSPERFRAFLEETYSGKQVYLNPVDVLDAQSRGIAVPDTALEQIDGTGSDVVLPMADFLSDSQFAESLKGFAKMTPESISRAELESGAGMDAARSLLEKAQASADIKIEADEIYNEVVDQLIATKRMRPTEARYSAQLIPAYATVKAQQYGIPVREVYDRMGLKIIGPTEQIPGDVTEEVEQRPAREQDFAGVTLTQTRQVVETGEEVTIEQDAQRVWDQAHKRREMIDKLRGCLNA
ncbi:hypothetical protein [Litorivivens sp.]|uniref:hypothetical protein n=1 Tax=Litorivivens sp. TaxID=2020868 RepID=UPI0035617EB0